MRVGGLELDLARRAGPRRGPRHRPLGPRVPPALPPRLATPGEVVSRERLLSEVWGYSFDPGSNVVDVCVRRLRKKLGPAVPDRDRAACGLPAGRRLAQLDLAWAALAVGCLAADGRVAVLGDDPVPRHLDQPDVALRLPRLVALDDLGVLGGRRDRHRRVDHDRRVRRRPALGRAVRGAADVGDVRRDGLARAAARRGARDGRGARRRTRGAARAGGAAAPRRLARAADPRDDRARPSRPARRGGSAPTRPSSTSPSTSSRGSSGSSTACCCSRGRSAPTSRPRAVRLVPFLEDVFMRWAEVAPRAWRLGEILDVTCQADETWLRAALDALLENAVQYTDDHARSSSRRTARPTRRASRSPTRAPASPRSR